MNGGEIMIKKEELMFNRKETKRIFRDAVIAGERFRKAMLKAKKNLGLWSWENIT